jgi:hypothetical protein
MKLILLFVMMCSAITAGEYEKKLVALPSALSIKKTLQHDFYLNDLCTKSHLAERLGGKRMTYSELHTVLHTSIGQWADYHKNMMIALCAEPTAQLVVKTIFQKQPRLWTDYDLFVQYQKEIQEVQTYLV